METPDKSLGVLIFNDYETMQEIRIEFEAPREIQKPEELQAQLKSFC